MSYIYQGKGLVGFLGNHWSDYAGGDADFDGIGDTAHVFGLDRDNFPLMKAVESYSIISWFPDCQLQDFFETGENIAGSAPAIGADGTVYFAAKDAYAGSFYGLFAILPDGTAKAGWPFPLGAAGATPAIGSSGTVYVGAEDHKLYAIEPDGTKKWSFDTGDEMNGTKSPAIGADGTIYITTGNPYTGTGVAKLYAINLDGSEKWSFSDTGNYDWSSPAVAADGTIYAAAYNGRLYAFNAAGSVKWSRDIGGWPNWGLAIDKDGVVYVAYGGVLHAFTPGGVEKPGWPVTLNSDDVRTATVIASDGTLYIGVATGLHAIHPDGTEKWFFPRVSVNTTPAIGDDGTIYFSLWDAGGFHVLNPDGTPKCFSPTGSPTDSSPVIGKDGTVYAGYWDGKLYKYKGDSRGLANSTWPMYQGNERHSSVASQVTPGRPGRIGVGLNGPAGRGYLEEMSGKTPFDNLRWPRVDWPAYWRWGTTRPVFCELDGDDPEEIVVGLGRGGAGWLEVLDDDYTRLAWIQVDWKTYNAANGETRPACGDTDGDGRDEIIIGLGVGGGGWLDVKDDAVAGFAHLQWTLVPWSVYNARNGETYPVAGDLDGDGQAEIIIGLGRYAGGWLEVKDDDLSHASWTQVSWPNYNAANGATYPAAGDLDGDGRDEIIIGLGRYPSSGGWLEVKDDDLSHSSWTRVPWTEYNEANGATHPAAGDINGDGRPEIVVGLGSYPVNGGWMEVKDHTLKHLDWARLHWRGYNAADGTTWPVVGRPAP